MIRVRRYQHEVDALAGAKIMVEVEDPNESTHVILSNFEAAHMVAGLDLLRQIAIAEDDRFMYKSIRDASKIYGPRWIKYNRQFKNATMQRLRAMRRAIMWLNKGEKNGNS
jgi:hypothetical protein